MDKAQFRELLEKYRNDTLTNEERSLLDKWYDSFDNDGDVPPLKERETAIYHDLRTALMAHTGRRRSRTILLRLAVAACVAGIIGIIAVVFAPSGNDLSRATHPLTAARLDTVNTGTGAMKKVLLPDSSVIWLNAASTIRFDNDHFSGNRTVFLDEGEAFFDVSRDPAHPFVVHTPSLTTQVLGTSFNIRSYKQLDYTVLQVKTGMVRVTGGSYADSLVLNADQAVVLEKGVLHRKDAGSFDMSAWKEGVIRLQEASFNEMALMLHNHYSVTVRAETPAIIQYRYSMTVYDKNTLEDILALICAVHNNQYRRYNNEIVIY